MPEVGVHEAEATLPALLRRVATGEEITITSAGKPVARLIPAQPAAEQPPVASLAPDQPPVASLAPDQPPVASLAPDRKLGRDRGLFQVPPDFDAPLPDDVLADFDLRFSD